MRSSTQRAQVVILLACLLGACWPADAAWRRTRGTAMQRQRERTAAGFCDEALQQLTDSLEQVHAGSRFQGATFEAKLAQSTSSTAAAAEKDASELAKSLGADSGSGLFSTIVKLACAKHHELRLASEPGKDARFLKPCAPVDYDVPAEVPRSFFEGSFVFPHETDDAAEFVRELGNHDYCYHVSGLSFGTNFAVLVGMTPARTDFSDNAKSNDMARFYSVQSDICHTYQLLLSYGMPRRNIVVFTFADMFNALTHPGTDGGFWHKTGGDRRGVGFKCGADTVPIDYSGHMLADGAAASAKWRDMVKNDKINVPMVRAVLEGNTKYLAKKCADSKDLVESGEVYCTGRAIQTTGQDNVLLHLNGHGGSNDIKFGPLFKAQLNALFLGDTHYPESLSKMPWYKMMWHRAALALKSWIGAADATYNNIVGSAAIKLAFRDRLSLMLKQMKANDKYKKFAIYINACKSGGLFDENSGAEANLAEANAYIMTSAPKEDPSSTFVPAELKSVKFFNEVSGETDSARIQATTFFANFWHDSIVRNNPLHMTHEQERWLMEALGGPFEIFKKGTRRSKKGLQGSKTLAFHPESFGSFRDEAVGDIVVSPVYRTWYRPTFQALQWLKFEFCIDSQSSEPSTPERILRRAKEDTLLAEVLRLAATNPAEGSAPLRKLQKILDVNRILLDQSVLSKKAGHSAHRYKKPEKLRERIASLVGDVATLTDGDNEKYVRRYLEGLMDAQLNSALGALPQEQKDRIRELEALATGSAWSAARDRFMELLLGHVKSVEFSRLIDKCGEIGQADTAADACRCVGFADPFEPQERADARFEALNPMKPDGSGEKEPKIPWRLAPWVSVVNEKDSMTSKELTLEVQVVKVIGLDARSGGFGFLSSDSVTNGKVKVTAYRAASTPSDEEAGISSKEQQETSVVAPDQNTPNDLVWQDPETLVFESMCDTVDAPGDSNNRDVLELSVFDQSDVFLGQVTMAVGALLPGAEMDHWRELTLPLHVKFAGAGKTGKGKKCEQGPRQQPDYCASLHEWIPDKKTLDWQLQNPSEHALHKLQLFKSTEEGGDSTSQPVVEVELGDQCPPIAPEGRTAPVGRCEAWFTPTDRGEKKKDKSKDYGSIVFRVKVSKQTDGGSDMPTTAGEL